MPCSRCGLPPSNVPYKTSLLLPLLQRFRFSCFIILKIFIYFFFLFFSLYFFACSFLAATVFSCFLRFYCLLFCLSVFMYAYDFYCCCDCCCIWYCRGSSHLKLRSNCRLIYAKAVSEAFPCLTRCDLAVVRMEDNSNNNNSGSNNSDNNNINRSVS